MLRRRPPGLYIAVLSGEPARMAAAARKRKTARPAIAAAPLVGIIMGSQSDWAVMRNAADTLGMLQVPFEARIVSAHRTPERLYAYADSAQERGLKVIIAAAGGAAHLPGMTAAMTLLPVLGVPMSATGLQGFDSLLSIVQMPAGVPVGTLAIGRAGAINAALLAASILGLSDAKLMRRVEEYRKRQTASVPIEPRDEPPPA